MQGVTPAGARETPTFHRPGRARVSGWVVSYTLTSSVSSKFVGCALLRAQRTYCNPSFSDCLATPSRSSHTTSMLARGACTPDPEPAASLCVPDERAVAPCADALLLRLTLCSAISSFLPQLAQVSQAGKPLQWVWPVLPQLPTLPLILATGSLRRTVDPSPMRCQISQRNWYVVPPGRQSLRPPQATASRMILTWPPRADSFADPHGRPSSRVTRQKLREGCCGRPPRGTRLWPQSPHLHRSIRTSHRSCRPKR